MPRDGERASADINGAPKMRLLSSRAHLPILAGAMFAVGLLVNAAVVPPPSRHPAALAVPAFGVARGAQPAGFGGARPAALDPRYSAEVVHVIDGDTFEARVTIWPGVEVNTRVRLRGIDAPELHARCDDEWTRAQTARTALERILAQGGVTIAQVGPDKYAGRVDAVVSTRNTADVSAALLSGGWVRSYDGGRRGSWC
jgi:endonuclease YncB( thermonuclease family)